MCDLQFVDDEENLTSLTDKSFEELVELFPYYPNRSSYKVRIDIHQPQYGNISVQQCIDVLEDTDIYMYAIEKLGTANPHFQALVVTSVRRDTMMARIKKLGASGSGFSCSKSKEQWPLEYMAYLLKEGKPEYHNFPEEVRLAVVKRQDFVKRTYLDKKAEKTRIPVWRKIMETIPKDFDYYDDQSRFTVMKYVIKYHKDNTLLLRRGNLVAYMDTICMHQCGDLFENSYIYDLIKN